MNLNMEFKDKKWWKLGYMSKRERKTNDENHGAMKWKEKQKIKVLEGKDQM